VGFLDKAEEKIESAVNSLFAKFSKAQLQPVEVSQAIRSAMDLAAKKDPLSPTNTYFLLMPPMQTRSPRPCWQPFGLS
jgi:hypothetical protein